MSSKSLKTIKIIARTLAILMLIGGLPFYFGYGNPLPFVDPEYTAFDNMWLVIFPLMFLGMLLGWFYEKVGGYLIVIPVGIGFFLSPILGDEFIFFMALPWLVGALYLIVGYKE